MKRLSKAQEKDRDAHLKALQETSEAAAAAYAEYTEKLEAFIDASADANRFREELAGEMESYYDERSERWQDGDAGQAYSEWKETWAEELPVPEMPEAPEWDAAGETLGNLETEPYC